MRNRRLTLKREPLTPLSTDELSSVAGGSHFCPLTHGPSFDQACPTPTLPLNECGTIGRPCFEIVALNC